MRVTRISDGTDLVAYGENTAPDRTYVFTTNSTTFPKDNRIGIGRSDERNNMSASNSKIGETVLYDKKLTTEEIQSTVDYMVNKWK